MASGAEVTAVFDGVDSLLAAGPADLGATGWVRLEAGAVEAFAAATLAPCPPPGGAVPAVMVLATTSRFLAELLRVEGASAGINYGTGRVRFNAPVRAGDLLRGRGFLSAVTEVPGGAQVSVELRVEVEGSDEPACVVESLSRWLR